MFIFSVLMGLSLGVILSQIGRIRRFFKRSQSMFIFDENTGMHWPTERYSRDKWEKRKSNRYKSVAIGILILLLISIFSAGDALADDTTPPPPFTCTPGYCLVYTVDAHMWQCISCAPPLVPLPSDLMTPAPKTTVQAFAPNAVDWLGMLTELSRKWSE